MLQLQNKWDKVIEHYEELAFSIDNSNMIEMCQNFKEIDPEVRDTLLKKYLTSVERLTWV